VRSALPAPCAYTARYEGAAELAAAGCCEEAVGLCTGNVTKMEAALKHFQDMEAAALISAARFSAARQQSQRFGMAFSPADGGLHDQASWNRSSYYNELVKPRSSPLRGVAPRVPFSITSEELQGTWKDDKGHTVLVETSGVDLETLSVTILRPHRDDLRLSCQCGWQGGRYEWRCGGALLDGVGSSISRLVWRFRNDTTSVWLRSDEQALNSTLSLPRRSSLDPEPDSHTVFERLMTEFTGRHSSDLSEHGLQQATYLQMAPSTVPQFSIGEKQIAEYEPETTPETASLEEYYAYSDSEHTEASLTASVHWQNSQELLPQQDMTPQPIMNEAPEAHLVGFVPCVMPNSPVFYVPQSVFYPAS